VGGESNEVKVRLRYGQPRSSPAAYVLEFSTASSSLLAHALSYDCEYVAV